MVGPESADDRGGDLGRRPNLKEGERRIGAGDGLACLAQIEVAAHRALVPRAHNRLHEAGVATDVRVHRRTISFMGRRGLFDAGGLVGPESADDRGGDLGRRPNLEEGKRRIGAGDGLARLARLAQVEIAAHCALVPRAHNRDHEAGVATDARVHRRAISFMGRRGLFDAGGLVGPESADDRGGDLGRRPNLEEGERRIGGRGGLEDRDLDTQAALPGLESVHSSHELLLRVEAYHASILEKGR